MVSLFGWRAAAPPEVSSVAAAPGPPPAPGRRSGYWSGPGRYLLLCGALFLLLLYHSFGNSWRGDFWIYAAAVGELKANPAHPANPLFGSAGAFAFLSPYLWVLGLGARLLRLHPVEALALQGLVNLVFFLGALYAFVVAWLGRRAAAFYALLFVLFLWGRGPWLFSSFFHLRSLAFVLPYPSTFAAALVLASLAAFRRLAGSDRQAWAAFLVPVSTVLWIVHPVNSLFLWVGLVACSLEKERPRRHWATLALVFAAGLGLAFLWPLFPLWGLWFQQSDVVHHGNDAMYDNPLPRIAPALIGVPFVLLRLRRNPRDPLALMALVLGGLVAYGGLFGKSSYGRLISHAVLVLQLVLADAAAALEERLAGLGSGARRLRPFLAPALATLLVAVSWTGAVRPTLEEGRQGDPHWLSFLEREVDREEDVVLTDVDNCWYVPSFRGKVVAYPMELPFVPDHAERLRAVERFFERGAPASERRDIIRRYGVSYVLVPRSPSLVQQARADELRPLGRPVFANADYELLRVDPMARVRSD
jgi:hypothetical protein